MARDPAFGDPSLVNAAGNEVLFSSNFILLNFKVPKISRRTQFYKHLQILGINRSFIVTLMKIIVAETTWGPFH